MKTILLLIICSIYFWLCDRKADQQVKVNNIASVKIDTINFKTQVQPILQKNCSPCHFNGGKMYLKMPFDKGETIINHESGVLKRFKNQNEITLINQFIQQNKIEK